MSSQTCLILEAQIKQEYHSMWIIRRDLLDSLFTSRDFCTTRPQLQALFAFFYSLIGALEPAHTSPLYQIHYLLIYLFIYYFVYVLCNIYSLITFISLHALAIPCVRLSHTFHRGIDSSHSRTRQMHSPHM